MDSPKFQITLLLSIMFIPLCRVSSHFKLSKFKIIKVINYFKSYRISYKFYLIFNITILLSYIRI